MKKLEGIITVTGILLIIGLPMFLLFAGTDTTKSNLDGERLISIYSYSEEKAVVKRVDIDSYEEDYDVLDGSTAREGIEIIDGLTPLAAPEIIEVPKIVEETVVIENEADALEVTEGNLVGELIVIDNQDEELIVEDAVPEWLDTLDGEDFVDATIETEEDLVLAITEDQEEEDLILTDDIIPQGLDLNDDVVIYEEVIISYKDEDISESYEPLSRIFPDDELAAYDSTDEEEIEMGDKVLPEGLEGGNIINFECSEMNDGFGSKIANVTYIDDSGNIKTANFAY